MPILGAHMSVAGGYFRAVERAAKSGCDCVQIFTKNNNQWRARQLTDEDAQRFQDALRVHRVTHPLSHASYLINLASPDQALWRKSVDAMVVELQRATRLRIPWVVVHPGAFVSSDEVSGIAAIIRALDEVHQQTTDTAAQCLLETTAGQGTNLGWRFEQLAQVFGGVRLPDRLGVCVDTCHIFAAGYEIRTAEHYAETMDRFDQIIGLKRIKAFHLNDSKKDLGTRVDRHEHIGEGCLGLEPFRLLLRDDRFTKIPMYLETPKGKADEDLDRRNLETLRCLAGS